MQLQIKSPKIWLANEAVDFRKGIDGLSEEVVKHHSNGLGEHLYIFYNRSKNKLKIIAHHRNGMMMIYKRLDKKKFTIKRNALGFYEINVAQLAWLLAGLDWVNMSEFNELNYTDYY